MLQKLADKMKVPHAKMPNNVVERFGNSSGGDHSDGNRPESRGQGHHGEIFACLAGFGGGLTWSAMLMRLGGWKFCEIIDFPNQAK